MQEGFLKTFIKLAIPIAVQNLIISSLNLVDTIIIGGLGERAIASVGLANQYFFVLNLLLFGISSGSSIFIAQYWGNKDQKNIRRIVGLCLIIGCVAAFIFTIGGILFPKQILGIFSTDPVVIRMGSHYLRIIALSYIFTAITFAYYFSSRSIGEVKVPMYVSSIALAINTFLNFSLVYGHCGLPKLGINGSAIGTLIARIIEMILVLIIVYKKKMPNAGTIKEMLDLSKDYINHFFRIALPVILNESMWGLGVTLYSVGYARIGTEAVASTNISGTVEKLTWVIFMGLGHACAVMIGNKIGAGDKKAAFRYAKRFIVVGPVIAVFMAIIVYFNAHFILSFYNVSDTVYSFAQKNLVVFSLFLVFKVFNFINVVGILRSGGDTKFCLFLDVGGVWLVGVPFAFLGAFLWHLPVYYVYALVSTEEIFKFIIGVPRIVSKKWINDVRVDTSVIE